MEWRCLIPLLHKDWIQSKYHQRAPIEFYNQANYFYENVRSAIHESKSIRPTVINREYELGGKQFDYIIERINGTVYRLQVERIGLNVYDSGIAVIAFHLINTKHRTGAEVLAINDFGRRLYPQFLDTAVDKDPAVQTIIQETQQAFLAKTIEIRSGNELPVFRESFEIYQNPQRLSQGIAADPYNLPNRPESVAKFLGPHFTTRRQRAPGNPQVLIRPILDDRMFVVCWMGDDVESANLQRWKEPEAAYHYQDFTASDFWMKYIFLDNSDNTIQSRRLRPKLAQEHTDDRWIEYGTLYGISRYSFVALTDGGDYARKIIRQHMAGVYFEMAQLALVQRATVIRFSDEATRIVTDHALSEDGIVEEARTLHEHYTRFINKLYFWEVTPQEQGIELYTMLAKHMEIVRDVESLNKEIDELHQFIRADQEARQTRQATNLTRVATIFLPATFIAGVMGMNSLPSPVPKFYLSTSPNSAFWISFILLVGLSAIGIWIINRLFKLRLFSGRGKK